MRSLGSQSYGTGNVYNVYKMRIYTFALGEILKVLKGWAKAMPTREKYAPLAACWHREVGGLNKFVHVWAYKRIEASKHFLPL